MRAVMTALALLSLLHTGSGAVVCAKKKPRFAYDVKLSALSYQHGGMGGSWAWELVTLGAGVRLFADLYLKAKISLPLPPFLVLGNTVSLGGELEYQVLPAIRRAPFALSVLSGVAYNWHWPRAVSVFGGPSIGGPSAAGQSPPLFDTSNGVRTWLLLRLGYAFAKGSMVGLDLGVDLRSQHVKHANSTTWSTHLWVGPYFGFVMAGAV